MGTLDRLYASDVKDAVVSYRDLLRTHQAAINRLNVYPVPDGDTGTNMALTVEAVVDECLTVHEMAGVCRALSHGSLMGARGNSGVILSQVLRGLADVWKSQEHIGADELVAGLEAAVRGAYAAVLRPVEGTILTVLRGAAEAATQVRRGPHRLVDVLDAARVAAGDCLQDTPRLLPVLKEAGVVDAGGAGLVLLLDAFLHHVAQRPLPDPTELWGMYGTPSLSVTSGAAGPDARPRYEVMYLLEADDAAVPAFKQRWARLGDSIVVVGAEGLWNCHIHTDDVGGAIEAALDAGRPRRIRVTDLNDQVEEASWVRDAVAAQGDDAEERCACAVVAVGTGAGVGRIFRSLGAQQIVAGGQSMNPSTAQILEAVEAAASDEVVVLPNNKNIVAVAQQVDALTAKTVRVVATTSVAEGLAALLDYDALLDAATNAVAMADAAARVVSGEITRAVRSANSPAGPIAEGDYLGMATGGILAIDADLPSAAVRLLDRLVESDHEIVTIVAGDGSSVEATDHVVAWLQQHRPSVEVEVHDGGQPLYPYLFSIE